MPTRPSQNCVLTQNRRVAARSPVITITWTLHYEKTARLIETVKRGYILADILKDDIRLTFVIRRSKGESFKNNNGKFSKNNNVACNSTYNYLMTKYSRTREIQHREESNDCKSFVRNAIDTLRGKVEREPIVRDVRAGRYGAVLKMSTLMPKPTPWRRICQDNRRPDCARSASAPEAQCVFRARATKLVSQSWQDVDEAA